MNLREFDKKFLFSRFLPYGISSLKAIQLDKPDASSPTQLIMSYDLAVDERIYNAHLEHLARQQHIHKFEVSQYAEPKDNRFGNKTEQQIQCLCLTEYGINTICGYADPEKEAARLQQTFKKAPKTVRFKSFSCHTLTDEEDFYLLSEKEQNRHTSATAERAYQEALNMVLSHNNTSILCSGLAYVPYISTIRRSNAKQTWHQYRINNIQSLFISNGFLTCIDRRPMCAPLTDKQRENLDKTLQEKIENKTLDFKAFAETIIAKWYDEHPDSYYYAEPAKKLTPAEIAQWNVTPAFYRLNDIPTLNSAEWDDITSLNKIKKSGNARGLFTSCMGVAIGSQHNYLVYHSRPGKIIWASAREKYAAETIQNAIDQYGLTHQIPGVNKTIQYAIMVCTTVNQFATLFADTKRNATVQYGEKKLGAPFNTVCIVTMNQTGVNLLRQLMHSSPEQYLEAICMKIREEENRECNKHHKLGLTPIPDAVYSFSLHGKPVLCAYTMEWNRIHIAYEHYLQGERFYVMCFPEQVKYIKKIMPEAEFL